MFNISDPTYLIPKEMLVTLRQSNIVLEYRLRCELYVLSVPLLEEAVSCNDDLFLLLFAQHATHNFSKKEWIDF